MELSKVANLNDAAVAAFDTFNARKRFRSRTNLVRFHRELEEKYGKPIKEDQLVDMFKALEKAGMGSLIISRNKNNTRFAWNYSLRDVAKASKGELDTDELKKVTSAPTTQTRIIRRRPMAASPEPLKDEFVETLIIRHGVVQTLKLSSDKEQLFNDMINLFSK